MNLKILWMYHDLMDLYGDKGNAEVLRRRFAFRKQIYQTYKNI